MNQTQQDMEKRSEEIARLIRLNERREKELAARKTR